MPDESGQLWGRGDTALTDQQVGTRLNGAPGPGQSPMGPYAPGKGPTGPFVPGSPGSPASPGGAPDFASSPAEKKAAATTIENELQPDTKKAAGHADTTTETARKGFDGWETAAGLKTVADTWDQQVKTLMGRLAGEKSALRGANSLITGNDTGLRSQFLTSPSKLNGL
ncbi:hypothetical protein ACGFXC_04350 [Streptomyces sp. NPDC048507]|uniref:hypothetical protein n=1 Tax=Streptomyces sp. NPDC048507 TaxID=3365560 RepID=UPI00371D0D91